MVLRERPNLPGPLPRCSHGSPPTLCVWLFSRMFPHPPPHVITINCNNYPSWFLRISEMPLCPHIFWYCSVLGCQHGYDSNIQSFGFLVSVSPGVVNHLPFSFGPHQYQSVLLNTLSFLVTTGRTKSSICRPHTQTRPNLRQWYIGSLCITSLSELVAWWLLLELARQGSPAPHQRKQTNGTCVGLCALLERLPGLLTNWPKRPHVCSGDFQKPERCVCFFNKPSCIGERLYDSLFVCWH